MGGRDMTTKRLGAPPAFEAHDVIAPDRLLYRDRRCPGADSLLFRLAEANERLMNGRDQSADLVSLDLIALYKCGHNPRREFPMGQYGRELIRHRILRLFQKQHIGKMRDIPAKLH